MGAHWSVPAWLERRPRVAGSDSRILFSISSRRGSEQNLESYCNTSKANKAAAEATARPRLRKVHAQVGTCTYRRRLGPWLGVSDPLHGPPTPDLASPAAAHPRAASAPRAHFLASLFSRPSGCLPGFLVSKLVGLVHRKYRYLLDRLWSTLSAAQVSKRCWSWSLLVMTPDLHLLRLGASPPPRLWGTSLLLSVYFNMRLTLRQQRRQKTQKPLRAMEALQLPYLGQRIL